MGDVGRFDLWQPDVEIPLWFGQAAKVWVIVGVLCFSRFMAATMIGSHATHDVLGGDLKILQASSRRPTSTGSWTRGSPHARTDASTGSPVPRSTWSLRIGKVMRPLPPVLPETAWRHATRLGRDHYVRFDTCDYSIRASAIGSWVDVRADHDWLVAPAGSRSPATHGPSRPTG